MMGTSNTLFGLLSVCTLLTLATLIEGGDDDGAMQHSAQLVRKLQLSDLALFTEARYTRHLSQADLHSAFQDHPGALEHFPSGSLASPPRQLFNAHPDP
jgi:hypothetical protein